MEKLIGSAVIFNQFRDIYDEKYSEKVKRDVLLYQQLKERIMRTQPLSGDDIESFGHTIEEEYSALPSDEIDKINWGGIPAIFCNQTFVDYFENQGPRYDNSEYYQPTNEPDEELFYKNAPAHNCQTLYYQCVDKIKSLGIDIYGIEKDLKKFKNRHVSSCCGGTTVFIFFAAKIIIVSLLSMWMIVIVFREYF